MLKAIVAQDDIAAGIDQQPRRCRTIPARRDRGAAASREQYRFIADAVGRVGGLHQARRARGSAVTPGHDARPKSRLRQLLGYPAYQRRFAGTADGQVADDDDRTRQPFCGDEASTVGESAQA
jgi:hypothetical protein